MSDFNILSIDGGGTRGIIPATILDCIYKETGKHPTELFSLLAGTSTGGILCTGLAYGIATADMVALYQDKAKDIFFDTGWDDLRDGFGKNLGADYSHKRFKNILENIFGEATLLDIYEHNKKLDLMVCSFDLNPEYDNQPVNFRPRVFHSHFKRDQNIRLVDLCLMTSAGPTYFPIYQHKYIDGGVSLNNPSMAALAYAINSKEDTKVTEYRHPDGIKKGLDKQLNELKLLSLGCGTSNTNYIASDTIKRKDNGDWGNLQWVKYLPDLLTESNVQASDYYVNQLLNEKQFKRLQLYFNSNDAPDAIRGKTLGLDVKSVDLLKAMKEYAEQLWEKEKDAILAHLGI